MQSKKIMLCLMAAIPAFAVQQSQADLPSTPTVAATSPVSTVTQPIQMADDSVLQQARELMEKLKGAQGESTKSPQSDQPTKEAPAAIKESKAPAGDPCKLLTTDELRKVLPNVKTAERERSTDEYGITSCVWRDDKGIRTFILQRSDEEPGSVKQNLEGYVVMGYAENPLDPAARKGFRFEAIKGVGDEAMAVVETADQKRGITGDVAMLFTQKGKRMVMLNAPTLNGRERAAAIKALEDLGRAAVKRL